MGVRHHRRVAYERRVSIATPGRTTARSAAVADLFSALEGLIISYQALPDTERSKQWSADADRITGEIARHLHGARHRIAAADPAQAPGG
jgi:hypothetical protein